MGTDKNTLDELADRYTRGRIARSELSANSAANTRYVLAKFSASFGKRPLDKLGPRAIDRWLGQIGHLSPASRRQHISVVTQFCRWLRSRGHIAVDPTSHIAPVRQPRSVPITLTEAEVAATLAAAPDARARAILWLCVGAGLRCKEAAGMMVEDYDPRSGDLTVRSGKGGHQREIYLPREGRRAVDAYLDEVGRRAGPLIRATTSSGAVTCAPIAPHTISKYVRRWMVAAGVKVRAYDGRSAHGLRRTAASDVLEQSGDLVAVQEMLGHQRLDTTARHYLRRVSKDRLREAMEGRTYTQPDQEAKAA